MAGGGPVVDQHRLVRDAVVVVLVPGVLLRPERPVLLRDGQPDLHRGLVMCVAVGGAAETVAAGPYVTAEEGGMCPPLEAGPAAKDGAHSRLACHSERSFNEHRTSCSPASEILIPGYKFSLGSSDPNTVFGPTNCKLENPTLTQWRQGRTRWWGFGVPGPRLGCERLSVADGEECSVVVDGASAEDVTTVRIERNLGVTTGTVSRGPRVTIVDNKNPLGLAAICDLLLIDWPYQGIITARSTTN